MNIKDKHQKNNSISFIIPAFNCEDTIEEAILSILNGNYCDGDEIVVVDDFSTDSTKLILRKLKRVYPQINIYQNKWNRGNAATRNIAIEKVKNEYIFCLDSDNILVKRSVRGLLKYMLKMKADSAAFQYIYFFKNTSDVVTHKWKFKKREITLADSLASHIVPGASGNYLFTKASWIKAGGYPQCRTLDTWGFGLRQLATGSKMVIMPDTFYYHRYGHDSNWIREKRKGKNSLIALQIILPLIDLIDKDDINYIMSEKYRLDWFDNLLKRPLKLTNERQGEGGEIVDEIIQDTHHLSLKSFLVKIEKLIKLNR
jgi:glycosyltransferase involved in cell wall biosynthesis